MLKAESENEIAATYLTLFQVLEIVKHFYSPQLGRKYPSLPEYINAILEDIGHLNHNQKIVNLIEVNLGRNNMVHKLRVPNATNFRTKEGLTTLFNVVETVLRKL